MIGSRKKRWSPFWTTPPRDLDETYLTGDEYLDAFKEEIGDESDSEASKATTSSADFQRLKSALAQAHDARKLEIDMMFVPNVSIRSFNVFTSMNRSCQIRLIAI